MNERKPLRTIVLREFGEIGRYRVRVIRTSERENAPVYLDIREYVRGSSYEGYTRKGVMLGRAEAIALRAILENAAELIG